MKRNRKRMKQAVAAILCMVLLHCPVFFVAAKETAEPSALCSAGAVLMDADSGRVLFSKGGKGVHPMASTTKIMTCILALELGEAEAIVTFSDYAASMPDVQMNAKAGEEYYLKDLLYSMMLESHNDSAAAVAEAIAGDVPSFAKLMNQKAAAIGCVDTHFVTPNGLDGADEGGEHVTTAEELAKILRYCISVSSKAEEFLEITGAQTHEFRELHGKRYVSCRNHNAFLTSYEGAMTGKTGFTGKAGYCYTGAARRDERTFIIALLGAGCYPHKTYKWKDARKLFDYGFADYHYEKVGKDIWNFANAKVTDGMEKEVSVSTDARSFLYLLKTGEQAECRVDCAEELSAPVAENMVIGTISYELDGKMIEQFRIYTGKSVEKSTFWNRWKRFLEKMFNFYKRLRCS